MKYHHGEDHRIWSYCTPLGPFEFEGRKYDLGVVHESIGNAWSLSYAIVYGKYPCEYISGYIYHTDGRPHIYGRPCPVRTETRRRWEELNHGLRSL